MSVNTDDKFRNRLGWAMYVTKIYKAHNVKYKDFCKYIGYTPDTVSEWFNDPERMPKMTALTDIAVYLSRLDGNQPFMHLMIMAGKMDYVRQANQRWIKKQQEKICLRTA